MTTLRTVEEVASDAISLQGYSDSFTAMKHSQKVITQDRLAISTALVEALEGIKDVICTKGGYGHEHNPWGCGETPCVFCKHHEDNLCEQTHKSMTSLDIETHNQALTEAQNIIKKLLHE